jgi:hypothetical protein
MAVEMTVISVKIITPHCIAFGNYLQDYIPNITVNFTFICVITQCYVCSTQFLWLWRIAELALKSYIDNSINELFAS